MQLHLSALALHSYTTSLINTCSIKYCENQSHIVWVLSFTLSFPQSNPPLFNRSRVQLFLRTRYSSGHHRETLELWQVAAKPSMFLANLNSSWAGQARKTWCASSHLVQAQSLCASGLAASTHMQRRAHIKVSTNPSYPWQAMSGCLLERPYLSHHCVTGYQDNNRSS